MVARRKVPVAAAEPVEAAPTEARVPISITDALRVVAANSKDAFFDAIADVIDIHLRKSADYGMAADTHSNIKASEKWGVPSWVGAMVRGADKDARIQKWLHDHKLTNESLHDAVLDKAVYGVIALTEFKQWEHDAKEGIGG